MNKNLIIFCALTIICLISIGANCYLYSDRAALLNDLADMESKVVTVAPIDNHPPKLEATTNNDASQEIAELNQYIAQLQQQLSKQKEQLTEVRSRSDRDRNTERSRRRETFQEREERMREEEPERYEEMQRRREEVRQNLAETTAKNIEYLKGVDTSKLSNAQRETLDKYQSLMAERQQFIDDMSSEEPPNFHQGGEILREMNDMREEVQEILFSQIGNGKYTEEIRSAVEATSNNFGPGGGRGPRR